jgi:hypothetical protein
MRGGGDGDFVDRLPDDPDMRSAVSDAQRALLKSRGVVRKTYAVLRTKAAEALAAAIPHEQLTGTFVRSTVAPRLEAVMAAVDGALRGYLSSRYDPPEADALLQGEERVRTNESWARARISPGDAIRYRFSEEPARIMYAIKMLRIVWQLAALWAASNAYGEAYDDAVHAKGGAPPPLTKMLYVFLCIDATMMLLTLLSLVVVSYVFMDAKDPKARLFVIDDDFLVGLLADYFVTTVAIGALGAMVAQLMRRKRYFDLASLGRRTVAGYGVFMGGACVAVGAVPFFLLL